MNQDLDHLSKRELLALAKDKGLKGVGAWSRDQLARKLRSLLEPFTRNKSAKPTTDAEAPPKAVVVPKARSGKAAKTAPTNLGDEAARVLPTAQEPPAVKPPATPAARPGAEPAAEPATQAAAEPGKPIFKKTTQVDELLAVDKELGELPSGYDEDRAVLLVRDPYWVYVYWDLSRASLDLVAVHGDFRHILRVLELGGSGTAEPVSFYDVPVPEAARSWYLRLPGDGRRYRVEVALQHRDGTYHPAARTNAVEMPRGEPSEVVADRFVTLPGGEGQLSEHPRTTLPPVAAWETMVTPLSAEAPPAAQSAPPAFPAFPAEPLGARKPAFGPRLSGPWSGEMPWALRPEAAGVPEAPGVGSQSVGSWSFGASENRFGAKQKSFWMVADAELIVYGATEPDAKVTLRGQRVDLRPDGTFSFRFYLPDGLHPIPIRAQNADGDDERMITITVSRGTTGDPRVNLLDAVARPLR